MKIRCSCGLAKNKCLTLYGQELWCSWPLNDLTTCVNEYPIHPFKLRHSLLASFVILARVLPSIVTDYEKEKKNIAVYASMCHTFTHTSSK